jgi:hypothetical protein
MDAFLAALGLELAAGAVTKSGEVVTGFLRGWAKGDEVTRLFVELDERLGAIPGLTATGLEPLRDDLEFVQLLAVFWGTGSFPRNEMIEVIEPHLGPAEDQTPRQLAEQVADAIDLYSARARKQDRELFAIEAARQSLAQQIESMRQDVLPPRDTAKPVSVDWAPPLTRQRLARLLEDGAVDLLPIQEALQGAGDKRPVIAGLVAQPPPWLVAATRRTWEALGDLADGYALWHEASIAFEAAAGVPEAGTDRGALLARAALAARLGGDLDRYRTLLDQASVLDSGHAQVILAQLDPEASPDERLAILNAAPEQHDVRRNAALDIARATAHLDKAEWDEAERLLHTVRERWSDNLSLRHLEPALVLARSQMAAKVGERVEAAPLRVAAAGLLEFREDLIAAHRYAESGRILARAIVAFALAGDKAEAKRRLGQVRREEREDPTTALDLVEAALTAEEPEIARSLAPADPQNARGRLAGAYAAAFSTDPDVTRAAVPVLDELLKSSDEAIRAEAAFARQVAALERGVRSSQIAKRLLEQESPSLAALLTAERLNRQGKRSEAQKRLLPYQDDPRILRTLISWAGQRQEWDRVLELSRALATKRPQPLDRLILADALYRNNERQEAIAELSALRNDNEAPADVRNDAYATSASIASDAHDFQALEQVSREWLDFNPSETRAGWTLTNALYHLARSVAAVEVIDRLGLDPQRLDQAELFVAVLSDAGDAERATREAARLSDQFDRPERLEAQFLLSALRVRDDDRLTDLREEIQKRWSEFPQRFPESQIIRSVPIDTSSPEGIDAFFREHIEPGAEHVQQTGKALSEGEVALAAFAAVVGRPVSLVMIQMEHTAPLGFGDPTLAVLEEESAEQAATRAVVWDPAALAVVAALPREIGEAIRTAFPGSVTAQAVIDDLHRASDAPSADRDEYSTIGYDAAQEQRYIHERSADDVLRERRAIERANEIAQALQIRPDVDPVRPTEIDQFLQGTDRDASFVTWPATLALAEREQKPLYSDDRYVRTNARRAGIPAFGTIAVLDALAARGFITKEQRLAARRQLRERGGAGVGVTVEELLDEARAVDWELTPSLRNALLDPTAWRQTVVQTYRIWGVLLRVAFLEASPVRFQKWVWRFLEAAKAKSAAASYNDIAQSLLLIAWQPFTQGSAEFLQALLAAIRNARRWWIDPLPGAAAKLAQIGNTQPTQMHGVLSRAFLGDLGIEDREKLLGLRKW